MLRLYHLDEWWWGRLSTSPDLLNGSSQFGPGMVSCHTRNSDPRIGSMVERSLPAEVGVTDDPKKSRRRVWYVHIGKGSDVCFSPVRQQTDY